MTSFFSAEGGPIWIKFRRLLQNDISTVVIWSKSRPDVEFQYGGRLDEFNGMLSQSYLLHCRVLPPGEFNDMSSHGHVSLCRVGRLLPLGEFTVMIPQPHAALLQGVRITSAILKVAFRHILFFFVFLCSLGFDERQLSYRLRYTCFEDVNYDAISITLSSFLVNLADIRLMFSTGTRSSVVAERPHDTL